MHLQCQKFRSVKFKKINKKNKKKQQKKPLPLQCSRENNIARTTGQWVDLPYFMSVFDSTAHLCLLKKPPIAAG